jgi:glycosyltransferase involved in cell wall biosynthesis
MSDPKVEPEWIVVGKDDPEYVRGGLNRYVQGLAAGLRERDVPFNLEVVGHESVGEIVSPARGSVFRRTLHFFARGWDLGAGNPRVLNIHFALYGAPFLLGFRMRRAVRVLQNRAGENTRLLTHFHGPWAEEVAVAREGRRAMSYNLRRAIERFVLRNSDRVIVLSESFAEVAVERYSVDPTLVEVVPPGIDREWFRPLGPVVRTREEIRLVAVRRLTPRMGHIALLNLLEQLDFDIDGVQVHLEIIGTGDEAGAIAEWVRRNERADRVSILGSVADHVLRDAVASADASVIPTLELEGFGLVVLEAFASGTPVLSTGQGGLKQAMGPWASAPWIFSIDDAEAFSQSLRAAAELKRSVDGLHDLQGYAKSFRWDSAIESFERLAAEKGA